MPPLRWTTENPTEPGFYWVVLLEHDSDLARDDIHWMAKGWRPSHRPVPLIAQICPDEDDPDGLIPFFVGMEDYPFRDIAQDFGRAWWCGPLPFPPAPPGLPPFQPPGVVGMRPFTVPEGWPPDDGAPV